MMGQYLSSYKKVYLDAELFSDVTYEVSLGADKEQILQILDEYIYIKSYSSNYSIKNKLE